MNKNRIRLGRGTLLWGAVGFCALQLALTIAVESRFPEFRDPVFGHKITRLKQRTTGPEPRPLTIVMLGSSRTVGGFKAGLLERPLAEACGRPVVVFNFGIHGAGPLIQLLNLQRILANGIRPDLLLVEVMPPLFAGQVPLHELDEERVPTDRLALRDLPLIERYAGPEREGLYRRWWLSALVPWYSHRFSILNDVATNCLPEPMQIEGFRGMDECGCVDQDWQEMTPARRKQVLEITHNCYAPLLLDFRLGDPACEGMRELLATCRREGIPAALVLMPEGPTFRSWYSADAWSRIQTYLDDLSRDYQTPVINARDWMAEEDFVDSHHQMARGAAAFTARLGQEFILPLLRQYSPATPANAPADIAHGATGQRR